MGGVSGLKLQISSTDARSWILRVTISGKVRDLGLGGYPNVSLKAAREHAQNLHEQIKAGVDPISERKKSVARLAKAQASMKTFDEVTAQFVASVEMGKYVSNLRITCSRKNVCS